MIIVKATELSENKGLLTNRGMLCTLAVLLLPAQGAVAQSGESHDLADLSAFQSAEANWSTASAIRADPEEEHSLEPVEGDGILVNQPTPAARANLLSRFEHGDADIELQFMMARGSNSGIYLQGRYEVQLLDSWGVTRPGFSDCGGIYQRRREDGTQYEGAAPRINACKAPGLWQDLRIAFQAPRFDADGRKRQNARFLSVEINGVPVHENLEVSGPTGGAIGNDEVAGAPLMIQGDHGPVAFRNFRLIPYDAAPPTLDVDYRVYYDSAELPLDGFDSLAGRTADAEGKATLLSHEVSRVREGFAILFDGTLEVSSGGIFEVEFFQMGFGWLHIDGQPVFDTEEHYDERGIRSTSVSLDPGTHRFQAGYLKKGARDWQQARPPALALSIEGPGFRRIYLHRPGGLRRPPVDPILVDADTDRIVRSFADVGPGGGTRERVMHAINVGSPQQLHYTLDYDQGTIVRVWRGEFLDTTPMWHQRGDGSSLPRGTEEFLTMRPLLARLADDRQPWPDPYASSGFRPVRYRIDAAGRPVFHYRFGDASVEDASRAMEGRRFERRLTFSATEPEMHVLLAESDNFEPVNAGLYAADDRRYYIRVSESGRTYVRESDGRTQLLATPGGNNTLTYEILF